jgi:uncharacterized RDD family membrane protein YckC
VRSRGQKTYKREVAIGCLLYCAWLGVAAVIWDSAPALAAMNVFVPSSFLFAAGAFGIDSYMKQRSPGET